VRAKRLFTLLGVGGLHPHLPADITASHIISRDIIT
jgi:hypothetical protein